MVGLYATATDTTSAMQYLAAIEKEHEFWMDGAASLKSGRRTDVSCGLQGGALLNRYWDDRPDPRPESYREDFELGQSLPGNEREALFTNIRAAAESGWDFSSRWMRDTTDLRTLETTDLSRSI